MQARRLRGTMKAERMPAPATRERPSSRRPAPHLGPALAVAAAYVAAGALWIVLSEWLLGRMAIDHRATLVQMVKGLGFVGVTGFALYLVLGRMMRTLQEGAQAQASLAARLREQSAQRRLLAHRLMRAEEDTRRAVAKDLHDGPLQSLTLSFMRLDAATRGPGEPIDPEEISNAMAAIREASEEIRSVVRALHPPLLAELGLASAVERHCMEMSRRTGREIEFAREARDEAPIDPDTAIATFRITQEAIANALKHTTSGAIVVRLSLGTGSVDMNVMDDGPGFNAESKIGAGLGLLSMRERAQSVGGALTIRSTPAGGTHVHVRIPDAAPEAPDAREATA